MISLIRAAWQEELRVPMFVGLSTDGYPDSDDPVMKNGARCYHMDTGAEYEYSADDDAWYPVPSGSGGASSWNQLSEKPFSTIGDGLEVDSSDNLNVVGQIIDVGSNYYMYESYFLPAINVTDLRTIYVNHKDNKTQVVKWTLLGSETYFNVLSADYIAGIYSLDILVHNKYHCQYNFEDSTTGNVNPEVLKDDIETFVFKGYVSTTEPSGTLKQNELWYQGSILPVVFPIQAKRYDGSAWSTETESYTPSTLDMWADLENDHGYYWFGNDWNIIDVNVSYDNVTIGVNTQNQLEIKNDGITINKISSLAKATSISINPTDDKLATEKAVDDYVVAKGYQTSAQVESAITGKGYQTSAQVQTAITNAIGNAIGGSY